MADTDLLDEIYSFCMLREKAKAAGEEGRKDWPARRNAQSMIRLYQELRLDILARPWTLGEGVDYFRRRAMGDRKHPDFKPEWAIDEE